MLAKTVAARYQDVEFVEESWATSALAQRYGVTALTGVVRRSL